ncbi:hypothetical protein V2J09_012174, partial [Rumex salicifolius]
KRLIYLLCTPLFADVSILFPTSRVFFSNSRFTSFLGFLNLIESSEIVIQSVSMDSNNWRQPSQTEQPPAEAAGGDWRSQLQNDSRHRIVNKIMDTLKRHLPSSGQEGVQELRKIAMRFEEKIYHAATSQSDYLRRISLKMLTMESKSNPPGAMPNAIPSNSAGMSRNPQDPVSMQPQVQNQGQSLSIPMASNQPAVQGRSQILNQNIQMNIGSATASLSSALPSVNSLAKNNMPNVIQNSNMQTMSGISQNPMGNSMVQGVASNNFSNPQKQMQVRQNIQQVGSQQPQNQQQYLYQQQQLQQQQLIKQKLHQGGIHQPLHIQQQTQQNNLLPSAQLQSSQQSVMQNSSGMQQPSMISGLPQNQPSSIQQSSQSAIQQHQQSVLRQQQQQAQQAPVHHQQTQMSQQSMLQSQQQQHLMSQQQLGQQTSMPDIQQPQRVLSQQNNLSSMSGQQQSNQNLQQQQIMGQQSNLPNMHQQQQLLGSQSGNPSMPTNHAHILQQSKALVQQQNPNGSALLSGGGQQPQQQQQMMQSQTAQLQQQLGLQQQSNSLQHNMQQRLQTPNALHQQQNVIDPQKMFQSQRTPTEAPSTSLDSTAQTSISESQEEVYQKIKEMKNLYFLEIHDLYQKISAKIQQHEALSQQAKSDGVDRLKCFKQMLERIVNYLQISRSAAQHFHKDKLPALEKQILSVLNSHRPRKTGPPLQQGQIPPSHMQSLQQNQQSHSQITQAQSHDNGVNSQLQSVNVQGSSVPNMQPGDMSGMHGSISSLTGITSSQPNMMNSLQPGSNLDSGQGNAPSSTQQNPVNAQQATPQPGMNMLHASLNSLQSNSNLLQGQHIKQQQEQQLKQQLQHRQQLLHKQQLFQQQQQQQQQQHLHMQQLKQQPGQIQGHQMPQIQQMNDGNDIKLRQSMGLKSGLLPQHLSQGQRYQQLKPGVSFPNSSPQLLPAGSPQINQHSSPQIDQQNILPQLTKVGTPLQSANSPFVPNMSPLAPSPMPGDPEKPNSASSNAANIIQQHTNIAPASASSLAIGTPGISASPLLVESSPPDGHVATLNTLPGKSGATDQPLDRLLKVVKSMSPKALNAVVDDIVSVVSMIDRIAGSAPGNGSRAAVGEDLVAMTKCRLQARNFITQDGSSGMKRMRRYTSAMPLNVASSVGSTNNSFKQLIGAEISELESTATSGVKRRRIEINPSILEEIKDTNEHLIDTVVDLSDEDVDPTLSAVAAEGGEGTIIKCTFSAVSLSPNLKSQYCSAQMSPIQPLRLLVPANYPNCSPILLDKFPVEISKEYDDLSVKVKSRFSISLRTLSQPMSLREIARTWDDCARCVITEYAQQSGGGTFSSKYGSWESCLSAT